MHAYRFRLLSDKNDEFVRDVEIKSTQSFKEFRDIIREVSAIEGNELASFFVCDRKWNKQSEITLIDMGSSIEEIEDDGTGRPEFNIPVTVMADAIIKDFIEDPHQRILYEYDILNQDSLFIELLKVFPAVEGIHYPVCITKMGTLKADTKPKEDFSPEEIDESELLKEFEEMLKGDREGDDYDMFADE